MYSFLSATESKQQPYKNTVADRKYNDTISMYLFLSAAESKQQLPRQPLTHTFSIPVTNNIYKEDYRYYLRHCQTTILYGTIHWE